MRIFHLLLISLAAAVINIALTPIATGIAAYFGYLMIICFWAYALLWTIQHRSMKVSILVLLLVVTLSILTSGAHFDSEDFRKKMVSLVSFISFYWMLSLPPDPNGRKGVTFKPIYYAALAFFLVFAVYAFAFPTVAYTPYGKYGVRVFTMEMGNPNGTSVYVLFAAMILLIAISTTKSRVKKAVLIVLVGVLAYIMFLLSSRTAFGCFILAVLCTLFLPHIKNKRIFRYIALFAPILMILIQFAFNDKIGDWELLGKELDTGRSELYRELLEQIAHTPVQYIFGNLCEHNLKNYHNGVLTVFASLGVVGVIWVLKTWNTLLRTIEMRLDTQNRYQQLAYLFVLLFLLDAVAESMTMSGVIPQGLFVYLMIKIAQGDIVPDEQLAVAGVNQTEIAVQGK